MDARLRWAGVHNKANWRNVVIYRLDVVVVIVLLRLGFQSHVHKHSVANSGCMVVDNNLTRDTWMT